MLKDISDEITLEKGRALPTGWSQAEIHHEGKRIGWLESGTPMDFVEGYSFKIIQEENQVRLVIFKKVGDG